MAVKEYIAVTRADMSGFDGQCIDLALEAQSLGWVGRMSTRGHLIMRSPDGVTTMSISSRWANNRNGANMRATLERWKRDAHTELGGKTPYEVADEAARDMRKQQFVDRLCAALLERTPSDLVEAGLIERLRPVYVNAFERPAVAEFAFRCSEEERVRDVGWMVEHDDDLDAIRPWNVNWAVFDRRSAEVIDVGGPREYKGTEWNLENVSLLVVEMMRREREENTHDGVMLGGQLLPNPEPEDDRPFHCDKCDRTFKKAMHLARHQSSHKNDNLAFEGTDEPLDLMSEVEFTSSEPADTELMVPHEGLAALGAMDRLVGDIGTIALRMSFLETERVHYEARLTEMSERYDAQIVTLTAERDAAVASVTALKSIVADL